MTSDDYGNIRTYYRNRYYKLTINFNNKTCSLQQTGADGQFNGGTCYMTPATVSITASNFNS